MTYPSDPFENKPDDIPDSQKLWVLADWFDVRDNERGYIGRRKVQEDLRRIASDLELEEIKP